jgi:hypothetical protein
MIVTEGTLGGFITWDNPFLSFGVLCMPSMGKHNVDCLIVLNVLEIQIIIHRLLMEQEP